MIRLTVSKEASYVDNYLDIEARLSREEQRHELPRWAYNEIEWLRHKLVVKKLRNMMTSRWDSVYFKE